MDREIVAFVVVLAMGVVAVDEAIVLVAVDGDIVVLVVVFAMVVVAVDGAKFVVTVV